MASQHGVRATKAVLKHPKVLVNEKSKRGFTALTFARIRNDLRTIRALLNDPRLNLKEHDQ